MLLFAYYVHTTLLVSLIRFAQGIFIIFIFSLQEVSILLKNIKKCLI